MESSKESLLRDLFLIQTIHQTTKKGTRNQSPYEMVFRYSPKTVLDLQFQKRENRENIGKENEDIKKFKLGDKVWFRKNIRGKWSS
uniref:Pyridox_oxase_2 domain-containing protein n=1 Tax=Strongyloides stercoralis TaxID=6248 RepID=A0A0K0ETE1_STRER